MKKFLNLCFIFLFIFVSVISAESELSIDEQINSYIVDTFVESDIPGMSIVIINGEKEFIKNYGYADVKNKKKVTSSTRFEIASCSKSYTALAVLKLQEQNKIDINKPVTEYIPWFYMQYNGIKQNILVKHLLYHTSGIPWETVSDIPQSDNDNSLEITVTKIIGNELVTKPGYEFSFATINYDILGLIIEKVSGQSYQVFMKEELFKPLKLNNTYVGRKFTDPKKSKGYKIGFLKAFEYRAPIYKGNDPAGYVVTDANDMTRWLKLHMGKISNDTSGYSDFIYKSHIPDRSIVPDKNLLSNYAYGWNVLQGQDGRISHDGLNPNFTCFIGFNNQKTHGVAILANSNSSYTSFIGNNILNILENKKLNNNKPNDLMDKGCSLIVIISILFLIALIGYMFSVVFEFLKKNRQFSKISIMEIIQIATFLFFSIPFAYALYILPKALINVNWETAIVWTPLSFISAIYLLLTVWVISFAFLILSSFFKNEKDIKKIPLLILLSIVSGISNTVIIYLITGSLYSDIKLIYMLYFYFLAFAVYILGRKLVETELIKITNNIIYNMRMKLFEKIFQTSYENFEKIDTGRVYATLNNDTEIIGHSAGIVVGFITSVVTVAWAFIIMGTISYEITALILVVIVAIAGIYYIATQKSMVYWESSRDSQNAFMDIVDGLVKGFKELCLHNNKKNEYKSDINDISVNYRDKISTAYIKFLNAFLVGESLLLVVIAFIAFAIPEIFTDFNANKLSVFLMMLLYLIGPINGILDAIPNIARIKVSWRRIKIFTEEISDGQENTRSKIEHYTNDLTIQSLKAENLWYEYDESEDKSKFVVGPIDLNVKKGEVLFIIGGNGSGKTTLAKLITGLYPACKGILSVNGLNVTNFEVGEFMSVIFNDFHIFEKLYEIDHIRKEAEITKYLKIFELDKKVSIIDGKFSTIDLSGGQRKRLALLRCYLEDRPVYLFDEWAADQDPEYRKFFYHKLLPDMKKAGKIVIAITHDDHYFDIADKIIKMDMGRIDFIKGFSDTKYLEQSIDQVRTLVQN